MNATDITKERMLHDYMLLVEHQRQEIKRLNQQIQELENAAEFSERLTNEIIRLYFSTGAPAPNIDRRRILSNSEPYQPCYEVFRHGEYATIVRKGI